MNEAFYKIRVPVSLRHDLLYRRVDLQVNPFGTLKREKEIKALRRNSEIEATNVRLVKDDGTHEVIALDIALKKARAAGLDLVEVTGGSAIPVVKALDYSQIEKDQRVKEKEKAKKMRELQKKERQREIRITPRITPDHLELKIKKISEFLDKKQKVMVVVKTRSANDEKMGRDALEYIHSLVASKAKVGKGDPKRQGTVSMTLLPIAD